MKKTISWSLLLYLLLFEFAVAQSDKDLPFSWDNANVYFVLTDRFENGDTSNDFAYGRQRNAGTLRNFEGGDLQGLINKLNEGYFDELGVSAIWITPPYENIRGLVGDAGYAFHGYWAKDWTAIDQNLGSESLFREFVDTSHEHGIRVIMDVVLNHVGPDNSSDQSWPEEWVRRDPTCTYDNPQTTIPCELVDNLPDIRTESNTNVALPGWLLDKWSREGRREKEETELNNYFNRTGKSRSPRQYIIKWLTDYVRKFGVDGFRVDTVKHVEEFVWKELEEEGRKALREWKNNNPDKKIDDRDFWMTGEVYNYNAPSMGRNFTGDGFNVDYYTNGFDNIIDFEFRFNANDGLESIFSKYDNLLQNQLGNGKSALFFLTNHDTPQVFDRNRTRTFEAGTKLLLTPGPCQIYYGDETARTLTPGGGAFGDATLRSNMNFNELSNPNSKASLTFTHFKKLGRFRREHISVGAGRHSKLQDTPYAFKREYNGVEGTDKTLVYTGNDGDFNGSLNVFGMWPDGTELKDYFSNATATVSGGTVRFGTNFGLVLIGTPASIPPPDTVSLSVNPESGFFPDPISVTMNASSATGAATTIFYTLDGSDPSSSGLIYTNPLNITSKTTVRSLAIDADGNQSEIINREYTIGELEPFTVYFKKPSDWSSAYIYIFDKSANAPIPGFPAWPGVEMTKLDNSSWYSYLIDESVEVGIVFNDNGGAQTDDLFRTIEGWYDTNLWTDTCPGECPTTPFEVYFKKPSSWNTAFIYLFDKNANAPIPGFPAWPGVEMNKLGNSPWYSYLVDESVEVGIVFNDNGGAQTDDLFRTTDGWYGNDIWTDTCPGECPMTPFDVYFKKPSTWDTAYIYIFDKNANAPIPGFPAWPGVAMNAIEGYPWYSYKIDAPVEVGIVFNDQGRAQGDDVFRNKEGWYDDRWYDECPSDCPSIDAIKDSFSNKIPINDAFQIVKAWPNPFNERLTLSFPENFKDVNVGIELFDLAGEKTSADIIKDTRTNTVLLNTENVPKGVYILRVVTDKNVKVMKLIK